MNYLVYEVDAGPKDIIEVTLDHAANVRLLDYSNYQNYKQGKQHRYHGGYYKVTPVKIVAPSQNHWYLTIDLGGYAGNVKVSVRVIKGT